MDEIPLFYLKGHVEQATDKSHLTAPQQVNDN